jgi:hypothetical protein
MLVRLSACVRLEEEAIKTEQNRKDQDQKDQAAPWHRGAKAAGILVVALSLDRPCFFVGHMLPFTLACATYPR